MDNYKDKLVEFNSTEKYERELLFLKGLLPRNGRVLDYGCGTGFAADVLDKGHHDVDGFDVSPVSDWDKFVTDPFQFYDAVYFMHSLAHIQDPEKVLKEQRHWLLKDARIIVITPNLDWINSKGQSGYNPDETVVQHFCQLRLEQLFIKSGYTIEQSGQFGQRLGPHNERLFLVAKRNKYFVK